jgi:hypothetical protein
MYHKLSYMPPGADNDETGSILRDGCLRIFRSHCKTVCDDAMTEYRNNLRNDQYSGFDRADSRADYYYQAHRETPQCITLAIPRPLPWTSIIHCVNEIIYDERPRLVSKFTACIGDANGVHNPMAEGKSIEGQFTRHHLTGFPVSQAASQTKSARESEILGQWNLGYHEIRKVSDMTTACCVPRPPFNAHGQSTTSFLHACGARPAEDPRWIKFCHLIGEDRCMRFLKEHLLPMIGPRPTGNSYDETKILTSSFSLTNVGTLRFSSSSISRNDSMQDL